MKYVIKKVIGEGNSFLFKAFCSKRFRTKIDQRTIGKIEDAKQGHVFFNFFNENC